MSTFMLGARALKKLALEQNALGFFQAKFSPPLFRGDKELELYEFFKKHYNECNQLPTVQTLEEKYPDLKQLDVPEPSVYYVKQVEKRYGYDLLNKATTDSRDILKKEPENVEDAWKLLQAAQNTWTAQKYRHKILDVNSDLAEMLVTQYHGSFDEDGVSNAFFGWPFLDELGGVAPGEIVSFVGRPATGKAQPLNSMVLTPTGWKKMGKLSIGDELASIDGQANYVDEIHPQGIKNIYKLTFSDGRSTEASGEHLWKVYYREWSAPRVLNTLQLIAKLTNKRYQNRLSIDCFSGVFGKKSDVKIPPYVMGALIGDGCFRGTGVGFTTADQEMVIRLDNELRGMGCYLGKISGKYQYLVNSTSGKHNPVKAALKYYGLWGKLSQDKEIPGQYLSLPREDRLELLRGLFDTDGTSEKTGGISFCSTSLVLARQVQYLIRSIGGKSSVATKKTKSLDAYIVSAVIDNRQQLFHLSRKRDRVLKERTTHTNHRLTLTSIERLEDEECQCITVSHPSSLYITDDFIVTHNSYKMLYSALYNWAVKHEHVLFVSMEMGNLLIGQRIGAMYTGTPVKQLMAGGFSTQTFEFFVDKIAGAQKEPAKLYVIDGNLAASVEDIYSLAHLLKCKRVFIDGAYMLRHPNPRLDRYTKVAENIEWMKRLNSDLKMATFASWQFAKTAVTKKKVKGAKEGLEDIGYSDAIGQISAIVIGIMQEEGVETIKKRKLELLKGRNGEIGAWEINWNFMTMDFTQVDINGPSAPDELQFI